MKELNKNELMGVDGGNVPIAFYMDSDCIEANTEIACKMAPVYGEVIWFFFSDIMRGIFL